jgi:hypothetical protein
LTDFRINLKEIELEFDDDVNADDRNRGGAVMHGDDQDDDEDEIKLRGPFEVDLLDHQTFITHLLGSLVIPNRPLEEIEIELDRGRNSASLMYGKSVFMAGTIDGTDFTFWHNRNEEFEIELEGRNRVFVTGEDLSVVIAVRLDEFTAAAVDLLAAAKDGNGDGTIEIDPLNTDGNATVAYKLFALLRSFIEVDD